MPEVLIIEDDLTFSKILEGFLTKLGYRVTRTHSAKEGIQTIQKKSFQLVLLDYRLPDATGLETLTHIKSLHPPLPVIIMTSFSDVRTAVKSIKSGAFEYITKPVNPDELAMLIQEALKTQTPSNVVKISNDFITGKGVESLKLEELINLVAPTDLSVIIEGESGTGKEHVARSIHHQSNRAGKPFIAVDCGALSKDLAASELFGHIKGSFTGATQDKEGQFAVANGGTLFLDEIGNLSYDIQVKLLRTLQERVIVPVGSIHEIHVDVRIITATNDDLTQKVDEKSFREDLYHRLNEFKLYIPSLRNRPEDLIDFINFFIRKANEELTRNVQRVSPSALEIFTRYDWPGNLRELKNTIKRAVLLSQSEQLELAALPTEMIEHVAHRPETKTYDLKAIQETTERQLILDILEKVRFNKSKAARLLNIDRTTLYQKMEKYGIE